MVKLSVNVNKIALIRNSRGANMPNLIKVAQDIESFGADGITVHPRPDERHIRYSDVPALKEVVQTELNVEGYPSEKFMAMVLQHKPHQCTLVPDPPGALTSDTGWDTMTHQSFLKDVVNRLKDAGIRTSLFIDPVKEQLDGALSTGTDRIEFYTGPYAHDYYEDRQKAIDPFVEASKYCNQIGLEMNAGHDLNLDNLNFFKNNISNLKEVSIGHALVCDALYYGLKNTVGMYLNELNRD